MKLGMLTHHQSRPPRRAWLFALLPVLVVFLASPNSAQAQTDVLEYHGNSSTSSGVNSTETQLSPSTVNVTNFQKLFTVTTTDIPNITGIPTSVLPSTQNYTAAGGQIYGQPLVKTGVTITTGANAGLHDVVFVATTLDSLYAIDANGGEVLWKDSFIYNAGGNPNPLNPTIPSGVTAAPGAYGTETNSQDIEPWIGIIGTPVIDGVNGYIYLVAKTREADGNENEPHYVLTLHKISLANGADTNTVIADTTYVSANSYIYNSGPYVFGNGTGATTLNGQSVVCLNAVRQMVRPALVLYGGRIYIASGSHGDNGPYHGWILTYDATSLTLNGVWNATPNGDEGEGGVWQSGGGVVIDPANGSIYFETGNGAFDGVTTNGVVSGLNSTGFPVNGNYGDCFVKLALDPTTSQSNQNINGWGLKIVDYFSPYNNHALDGVDEDLGSGGPTLLPDAAGSTAHPHLLLGGGKQGTLYLIDRDNMGKFGATDNVVQEFIGANSGFLCVPAYFNGTIYTTAAYGGYTQSLPLANATINTSSVQSSPDLIEFPGCSPTISATGTTSGIAWVIDKSSGELRAYNATNLSQELWTSDSNATRDSLGSSIKFSVPTVANGKVYVGTSNQLVVYGLPGVATSPPAAPSNLTASATTATTITLNWTDNSNNETAFLIERSVDDVNFTQIASVGTNVTTYGDSALSSDETYYYRVRATNAYNGVSYSAYTSAASATTPSVGTVLPVDLYAFDEGTGTTTLDSAGANNGTLIGTPLPTWVTPGRIGGANLSFSGSGVYNQNGQSAVQVGNDLSPVLGTTASLLFWIKTTATGNNTHWMAPSVTGVEQTGAANDIGWGYLDASGHICMAVGDNTLNSTSLINDGNWHHVALTRDAVGGVVDIYVDGILSSTANLGAGNKTSQFMLIGARSVVASDGVTFTGANFLNAQLDDVRIYNQVVSQALIDSIASPPAAVTNLTVTPASGTELDLSWTASASTNLTSYQVWGSIGTGSFTELAQLPPTATSYADTGLSQGTLYYYFVEAINTSGSAESAIVNATTPSPPATPTNAALAGLVPNQVDLSWVNNATNATGYYVLRASNGSTFVQIASLPAGSTYFADTTAQPGTTYNYHIQCYNSAGISDFAGLNVTTPSTFTAPSAPTNPVFTSTSGTTGTLAWVNNGLNATSYQVWVSVNGAAYTQLATLPATATSYALTGLSPGNSYSYYIAGVNTSASTNSVAVTVGGSGPVYVSDLAWVSIANGWNSAEKDLSVGGNTITIRGTTFTKGLGCHAYSEIDVPLNGAYGTFSSAVGIDDETYGKGTVDFQAVSNGVVLYDSGTLTGTSPLAYTGTLNVTGVTTLRLLVNIVGPNNFNDHSDWAGAQVTPTATSTSVPLAPTHLVATATTSTTGSLTWTNNATNATSNQVWVSVNSAAYTELTSLAATANSYALTGLNPANSYNYYIAAVNSAGYSDSAAVALPAAPTGPSAPTNLVATATTSTAGSLTWTNNGSNATSNQVWVSVNGAAYTELTSLSATTTSYALTGLNNPTNSYNYYIAAVNGAGSADSATVALPAPPVTGPSAPTNLVATATTSTTGSLTWTNNGSNATSNQVWVSVNGAAYTELTSLSAATTSYALSGLSPTTSYDYYIAAVNSAGSADSAAVALPAPPGAGPSAPTNLLAMATASTTGLLTWTNNATNATSNQVWVSVNGAAYTELTSLSATTTSYALSGLNPASSYFYYISAVNGSGSTDSAEVAKPVYVSDLSWVQVSNAVGPVEKDKNSIEQTSPGATAIKIRGKTYAKGLGCHANSEVDIPLNGAYSTFSSSIGIDDEAGGKGSVTFQVIANGVVLYTSPTITGTSAVVNVGPINVTGVTTLRLLVNIAGGDTFDDDADWAGAQLTP